LVLAAQLCAAVQREAEEVDRFRARAAPATVGGRFETFGIQARLQANSHWMETSGKAMQVAIHLARIPANKAMLRFNECGITLVHVSGEADTGHACSFPFL
jgi:hypothetical protein